MCQFGLCIHRPLATSALDQDADKVSSAFNASRQVHHTITLTPTNALSYFEITEVMADIAADTTVSDNTSVVLERRFNNNPYSEVGRRTYGSITSDCTNNQFGAMPTETGSPLFTSAPGEQVTIDFAVSVTNDSFSGTMCSRNAQVDGRQVTQKSAWTGAQFGRQWG